MSRSSALRADAIYKDPDHHVTDDHAYCQRRIKSDLGANHGLVLVNSTAEKVGHPGRGFAGRALRLVFSDDTLVRVVVLYYTSQSIRRNPCRFARAVVTQARERPQNVVGACGTSRLRCLTSNGFNGRHTLKYLQPSCPSSALTSARTSTRNMRASIGTMCVSTLEAA